MFWRGKVGKREEFWGERENLGGGGKDRGKIFRLGGEKRGGERGGI